MERVSVLFARTLAGMKDSEWNDNSFMPFSKSKSFSVTGEKLLVNI